MNRADIVFSVVGFWIAVLGIGIVIGLVWVMPSYFEARAYNRITGKDVSTWDAMFVELRVQDSAAP